MISLLRRGAAAAAALLLVTGCAQDAPGAGSRVPSAERLERDCSSAVDALVATAQRYLDSIERTSAAGPADGPTEVVDEAAQEQAFTQALSSLQAHAAGLGCDRGRYREMLVAGLEQLHAGGPVARAVQLQLQADADPARRSSVVAAGDDLAAAVAAAPAGAVVELGPGEHVLEEALVLLRGVTLRGAGRDDTSVSGSSGSGVLLVLTGEPVEVEQVTLRHTGGQSASVVSAAPTATLSLTSVRVTGARGDDDGGIGVLMAAGGAAREGVVRRTSLRVLDSEVVDNAVAGVVASGQHRIELSGAVVSGSAQCGVCFLATSDGSVRDSTFADNGGGVVVAGDARPALTGLQVRGGQIGVQATDRAEPVVERVDISSVERAGLLFSGSSAGVVRAVTCTDVPAGLVVGPQAAPTLEDNDCELARGQ